MLQNITSSAPKSTLADSLPDLESIVSIPVETRFFLGSVLEEAITQLPEVHCVRIITSQYWIDEIEVLSARDSTPPGLLVEVLTLLRVGFGLLVDDRCIRIVQSL